MDDRSLPLIEVTIAAPVTDVWAHLRDPALIARWFGWEYDGLTDEIELIFAQASTATEPTDPADPVHVLEWIHGPEQGDRIELRPSGDQTVLRLTRWAPVGDDGWEGIYDDIAEGWISFVEQLRVALAGHAGAERRTVFCASPVGPAAADGAAAALGVASIVGDVGTRFAASIGPEPMWSGTVAFRHQHQVGLAVDDLGPGLLVLVTKPADADPPRGSAMVTLTAYGARPDEIAELDARWQAWWSVHIAPPDDTTAA